MMVPERILHDENETSRFAGMLSRALVDSGLDEAPLVVLLRGPLGAGKTTLVRALMGAMDWRGPVRSPTFTLMEPYSLSAFDVYHFDLYRFDLDQQWFDAGFDDEVRQPGLHLIEWPERASAALAAGDITLELAPGDTADQRRLRINAHTPEGLSCLARLSAAAS